MNNESIVPDHVREHLRQDPVLAPLLEGPEPRWRDDYGGDVYFGLLRSIAYQQLSGKAAATIWGRFLALFPDGYPHPEQLLELEDTAIRGAGMSRSKTNYLRNVANYWREHKLLNADWEKYSDQEILEMLTSIKGVGNWTTEMVLMFVLHREDLLPVDDLVVRRGIMELYGVSEELRGKKLVAELERVTAGWRPYRSWGSRYVWARG